MKKVVLSTVAISTFSATYFGVASAQFTEQPITPISLIASIACPIPTPSPTVPPPPQKVVVGQEVEVFYVAVTCHESGVVPVDLDFSLGSDQGVRKALPSIRATPIQTYFPNPNPAPTPVPTPPPPPPPPPIVLTYSRAGSVQLNELGFFSICVSVSLPIGTPPPINFTFGQCVRYQVVGETRNVPLSTWLPAALSLMVIGVLLRISSKSRSATELKSIKRRPAA
jgi:hypothetical protein